jgi:hypothetical protein
MATRPKAEAIRAALAAAEAAGVPAAILRRAAKEVVDLLDALALGPDPRRLTTIAKARRIQRADRLAGGKDRAALCERFGLQRSRLYWYLRLSCDPQESPTLQRGQSIQETAP